MTSVILFTLIALWIQGLMIGGSVYLLDVNKVDRKHLLASALLSANCSPLAAGISNWYFGEYNLTLTLAIGTGVALIISIAGVNELRKTIKGLSLLLFYFIKNKFVKAKS